MHIYARINKETMRCIREKKAVSFDYVTRMTKFPEAKVTQWEDEASGKFPTINQAKALAKCYRIPFAGLYMNFSDINVKHYLQHHSCAQLKAILKDQTVCIGLMLSHTIGVFLK